MPSTDLANLPYPDNTPAPDVPAAMMGLAEAIDPRLNLLAADAADRDSKYGDAPAGTLVSTPDGWQWVRLTDLSWHVLSSVETTTSLVWPGDFSDLGGSTPSSIVTRRNGYLYTLSLAALYNGADISGGNFANVLVAQLPSGWVPGDQLVPISLILNSSDTVFGLISAGGNITLTDMPTNYTISNGSGLRFKMSWSN